MLKLIAGSLFLISCFVMTVAQERPRVSSPAEVKLEFEYKLLATNRVATMENEISGFRTFGTPTSLLPSSPF
jgi:hypothetical protein